MYVEGKYYKGKGVQREWYFFKLFWQHVNILAALTNRTEIPIELLLSSKTEKFSSKLELAETVKLFRNNRKQLR